MKNALFLDIELFLYTFSIHLERKINYEEITKKLIFFAKTSFTRYVHLMYKSNFW